MDRTNDAHNLGPAPAFRPFNPSDIARVIHGTLDVRDHGLTPGYLVDPWQLLRYRRAQAATLAHLS